jgi:hypothetical protein
VVDGRADGATLWGAMEQIRWFVEAYAMGAGIELKPKKRGDQ